MEEMTTGLCPNCGHALQIPAGLRDLNVKEEDIPVLATNALKDACGFTNPIQATHEEIMAIYRAAM